MDVEVLTSELLVSGVFADRKPVPGGGDLWAIDVLVNRPGRGTELVDLLYQSEADPLAGVEFGQRVELVRLIKVRTWFERHPANYEWYLADCVRAAGQPGKAV